LEKVAQFQLKVAKVSQKVAKDWQKSPNFSKKWPK